MTSRGVMAVVGFALAGCTASGPPQPVAIADLRCDNGRGVHIEWWPERAAVAYGGERWILPIAVSGSGARYADGIREVWEHQGEVRLTDGAAPPTLCR